VANPSFWRSILRTGAPFAAIRWLCTTRCCQNFSASTLKSLGISVDGVWCHAAFAKDRHLRFPLLADFEPKGRVAVEYGAYRSKDGVAERALFVVGKDGVIAWSYCSPITVNPGAEGILEALENLPK
jgi:peroxiredoxin